MPPVQTETLSSFDREVDFYFIPGEPARRILRRITTYPRWVRTVNEFLLRVIPKLRVEAIYAHGLSAAACEDVGVPMYYNPHGMEEFKTGGLKYAAYTRFRNMSRAAARLACSVIATDATLIPEIQTNLEVPVERVALIPNAVWMDEPVTAPGVSIPGDPLFLAAGRQETNKGFHILIDALSRATLPAEWKLVLAGSGSQSERLKRLASARTLQSHISFLGELKPQEMNALFLRADLFINPTLFEGSSIVTLEAMKAGLPVVGSRTGGLPDKVLPDRNGWLVQPGDAKALASAIEQACSNRIRWKEMGIESRNIVREKYSWDTAAESFLNLVHSGSKTSPADSKIITNP